MFQAPMRSVFGLSEKQKFLSEKTGAIVFRSWEEFYIVSGHLGRRRKLCLELLGKKNRKRYL
jgi:hypothetical protein